MNSPKQELIDFYHFLACKHGCTPGELGEKLPNNLYAQTVLGVLQNETPRDQIPNTSSVSVISGDVTPCGKNFIMLSPDGWLHFQELAPDMAVAYDMHKPTTEEMYALIASSESKKIHIDSLYKKFNRYTDVLLAELIQQSRIVEVNMDGERVFSIVI